MSAGAEEPNALVQLGRRQPHRAQHLRATVIGAL